MPRVLVVDDEPAVAEALRLYLKFAGYEALTALSGAEALRKVQGARPDLILLDIKMPKMDGLEVLHHIRLMDPGVRVIVFTAVRDEQVRREALAHGAADFVTKPVDLKYLGRTIAALLGPTPR